MYIYLPRNLNTPGDSNFDATSSEPTNPMVNFNGQADLSDIVTRAHNDMEVESENIKSDIKHLKDEIADIRKEFKNLN